MNLIKHVDFFNPSKYEKTIHIIGLGAIGSNLAMQLIRLGFTDFILYDFDQVEPKNIANQAYVNFDVESSKITAIRQHMLEVNPEANIILEHHGWIPGMHLEDIVFLCVDKIELRKEILEENEYNSKIEFVVDMRLGLEEAQMYAAKWRDDKAKQRIISTMQFSHDEVRVPVSACGTELTVLPTIQTIVSLGTMNLIHFLKENKYNYMSVINSLAGIANSFN